MKKSTYRLTFFNLILICISVVSSRLTIKPFGPSPPRRSLHTNDNKLNLPTTTKNFNTNDDIANLNFLEFVLLNNLDISTSDYEIKSTHKSKSTGVTHMYLKQKHMGLEVVNGDMNLNFKHDNFVSMSHSFYINNNFQSRQRSFVNNKHPKPKITPTKALKNLMSYIGLDLNSDIQLLKDDAKYLIRNVNKVSDDVKVELGYLHTTDATLELIWSIELDLVDDWFIAYVSADTGRVVSLINWVNEAQYKVFKMGTNDPNEGKRELLVDPHDKTASPLGWHDQTNGKTFTDTAGNNVYAVDGSNRDDDDDYKVKSRAQGGTTLNFDFDLDLNKEPSSYINASLTNLFYWNNKLHDLFYNYGFDEAAGNFQETNLSSEGKGNDAVVANAQDSSGYNNANFATPPDGRRPRMRMYVWDETVPFRDGDLEGGIITHEYSHGLSIRLTGGPANSNCLGWGEAGGMGEGWGDAIATMLRIKPHHNRTCNFGMGDYSNNKSIRKYLYSTDLKVNPETYQVMDNPGYWGVHAKGATWAEMLFEVYWNLVDELGMDPNWLEPNHHPNKIEKGNTLMLQLIIDGMKLQPCRPSFLDARDAILQAELLLTQGKYKCHIWKGFAKRGLGTLARLVDGTPWGGGQRMDSFELPVGC